MSSLVFKKIKLVNNKYLVSKHTCLGSQVMLVASEGMTFNMFKEKKEWVLIYSFYGFKCNIVETC